MKVPISVVLAVATSIVFGAEDATGIRILCSYDRGVCDSYAALDAKVRQTSEADIAALVALNSDFVAFARQIDALFVDGAPGRGLSKEQKDSIERDLTGLRDKINAVTFRSAPADIAALARRMGGIEKDADQLAKDARVKPRDLAALDARLSALDESGSALWSDFRSMALSVDRLGDPVDAKSHSLKPTGRIWNEQLDPLAGRIAALRDRLKAIERELNPEARTQAAAVAVNGASIGDSLAEKGLTKDPFARAQDLAAEQDSTEQTPARREQALRMSVTVNPKLLDSSVPPSALHPSEPFEIDGGKVEIDYTNEHRGGVVSYREDAFPDRTKRIKLLHKLGITKTVGDPGGRGRYAYYQDGGTCALASQAQLYAVAHGIEPTPQVMLGIEDGFFNRARQAQMFGGNSVGREYDQRMLHGTPDAYIGDLLDFPVKKHYDSTVDELAAVVKAGKMVHVAVDAGRFWNIRKYESSGHAIIVTGAEINRFTGRPVGFYINDTGVNPPRRGRFVTVEQLVPAWKGGGYAFTEPL